MREFRAQAIDGVDLDAVEPVGHTEHGLHHGMLLAGRYRREQLRRTDRGRQFGKDLGAWARIERKHLQHAGAGIERIVETVPALAKDDVTTELAT